MKQYLDLIEDILIHGEKRDDRTGVGTISVFGRQLRFDMQKGFPAVTTKSLAWKSVVSELLWFLEGSTNEHRLAEIKNDNKPYAELSEKERKTIWTLNAENQGKDLGYTNGDLGPIYGKQFTNLYSIDFNNCEIVERTNETDNTKIIKNDLQPINYSNKNELVGKKFKSKYGYECIVFDTETPNKTGQHIKYKVQFLESHSIQTFRKNQLLTGNFVDRYYPSIFGVGFSGYAQVKKNHKHTKEYILWHTMMSRCYNQSSKSFSCYGEKGVKVCNRWHNFENFLRDLPKIPYYDEWLKNDDYELDKDILSGVLYSPKTCIFIPKYYNSMLSNSKPVEFNEKLYVSVSDFSRKNNISYIKVLNHLNGKKTCKKLEGIKFVDLKENQKVVFKYRHYNQVQNVINEIKNNPTSRRIMVNAWNVSDLEKQSLPPCHYGFQLYVSGDKLSLMWNQRSVDTMLGLPFDIASYGVLLNIIAKMTGKIPNELICSLGDCHIYNNHLDGAREQLKRSPHNLPTLKMPDIDYQNLTIDEVVKAVKTSDFVLENYEHDDTIKMAMAV
jgi:thymidylate synthase